MIFKTMEIFDLFKRNAHKLEEQPAKAVWDRLENKLEKEDTKKSINKYKIFSIAACLFALVAAFGVIQHNFMHQNEAMVSLDKRLNFQLEDMVLTDANSYDAVNVSQYYDYANQPIEEGDQKKLIPNKAVLNSTQGNRRSYDRLRPKSDLHKNFSWILGSWIFKSAVKPAASAHDSMTNLANVKEAPALHAGIDKEDLILSFNGNIDALYLNTKKSDKNNLLFEGVNKKQQLMITRVDNNHFIINSNSFENDLLKLDKEVTLIYQNVVSF
jgi:hypothetical protein